jgi:hypothetical protein
MLPYTELIPLKLVHAFSSLGNIGCNVHSILDVIESVCFIKDCENISPIATTDPRDEMAVFGKLKISLQVRYQRNPLK